MSVTVRRIRSDDADTLRVYRLAALQDAPSAFGSTYDREVRFTPEEWIMRARSGAEGSERATFFALIGTTIVGLVGALRSEVDPSVVDLVSMWTSPDSRRTGVGRSLVGAVVEWSRAGGARAVELWVTRGNEAAERLYASCGFAETGDYQPLPSDPCRDELRMRRAL